MSSIVVSGDTSGSVTLSAPAVAGTVTVTLPSTSGVMAVGGGTITTLTTTSDITVQGLTVGRGAGAGSANTALGVSALTSAAGSNYNTALGYQSGFSTSTGNGANSFVGYQSGYAVTTGESNSFFGTNSAKATTSGSFNVAIGKDSLQANTTASYNTAVGYQAGYTNTTSAKNTYLGAFAGYTSNSAGDAFNVFVGYAAGYYTTGVNNTFVGQGSGQDITTGAKNTIIGRYSGNQGGLDIRTASNYIVLSDGDGNPRGYFTNAGAFHVPTMAVGGTANLHWSSGAGQFFVTSSSRRFKHDIVDYDKGLAELMQMQPKYFVYNDEPNQKQRAGFIAEDFHDLGMTEYVEYWKDDEGNDTPSEIGYSNMVAILVKSIQELKAEVDSLKAQLNGA